MLDLLAAKSQDFDLKSHEMVRGGQVEVTQVRVSNGAIEANIVVNDKFEHRFGADHSVSKSLEMMTPAQVAERLSGGNFFFVNEELVDYRDGQTKTFIHSDEAIQSLIDTIGFYERGQFNVVQRRGSRARAVNITANNAKIVMGTQWDASPFKVDDLDDGGEFESRLIYNWSPFMHHIRASYDLIREVCANGMIGMAPIFTPKIPLVNQWQSHLDIAARQIQHIIAEKTSAGIQKLHRSRATVADCSKVHELVLNRLEQPIDVIERAQLLNIRDIVNPYKHLSDVYTDKAIDSSITGAMLPSHLTGFSLYNIITEVNTHTSSTKKAPSSKLNAMANELLFGDKTTIEVADMTALQRSLDAVKSSNVRASSFNDPDQAFFGQLAA